jgi:hypothetical protein
MANVAGITTATFLYKHHVDTTKVDTTKVDTTKYDVHIVAVSTEPMPESNVWAVHNRIEFDCYAESWSMVEIGQEVYIKDVNGVVLPCKYRIMSITPKTREEDEEDQKEMEMEI